MILLCQCSMKFVLKTHYKRRKHQDSRQTILTILSYLCLRRQNNYPRVHLLICKLEPQIPIMLTLQSYYEHPIRNRSALNSGHNYFMQM